MVRSSLESIDLELQNCQLCDLYRNGRAKPYWTDKSKYMLILEAPGKEEVEYNETLIGKTGRLFWNIMSEYQFLKEDFIILNSVNCRVLNGRKNGKPSELHREKCRVWLKLYIKSFKPEKIMVLGNYALHTITGEWGIGKFYNSNKLMTEMDLFGIKTKVIRSYHPSALIYDRKKEDQLRKSIEILKGK